MKVIFLAYFLIVLCLTNSLSAQPKKIETDLFKKLLQIPDLEVKSIEVGSNFSEGFEIFVTQPLDHLNPNNGPKFTQRIFLHLVDFDKPMIMDNDGYEINFMRTTELADILNCNEIIVEHRYFRASVPDSINVAVFKYCPSRC